MDFLKHHFQLRWHQVFDDVEQGDAVEADIGKRQAAGICAHQGHTPTKFCRSVPGATW